MPKRLAISVVLLLLLPGGSPRANPGSGAGAGRVTTVRQDGAAGKEADVHAGRPAMIRALLKRSRLLEDARFTVPLALYRRFLAETSGAAWEEPAPVGFLAESADYGLALDAGRATLRATIRLHVFDPARCAGLPVLSSKRVWQDVTVDGRPAKLAVAGGWLRLSPGAKGTCTITAKADLGRQGAQGDARELEVQPAVRTYMSFRSPQVWEGEFVDVPLGAFRGSAGRGTSARAAVGTRDVLAWTWWTPHPQTARPVRLAVRGDVAWNLDPAEQQVTAQLRVRFLGGPADRLELTLPADAERLAVTGPDVRQVRAAAGRATIYLRQPVTDRTELAVRFDRPASARPELRSLGLASGQWAGGVLVVSSTAGGREVLPETVSGLKRMALADVPERASALLAGPAALAFDVRGRRWSARLDVVNLAEFALRESIADLAHYQLTFRPDGTVMCKVQYEVRNRGRQFLRLAAPKAARVLLTRVNEKPVPATPSAGAADEYLLPLVRSKASIKGLVSFPVEVVLMYRTAALDRQARAGLLGRTDRKGIPLPRIDLPIAYAWCEAFVPEGLKAKHWSGPLRKVDRFSSETAAAQMSYGSAELAEGYKAEHRPTVAAVDKQRANVEAELRRRQAQAEAAGSPVRPATEATPQPVLPGAGRNRLFSNRAKVRNETPPLALVTKPGSRSQPSPRAQSASGEELAKQAAVKDVSGMLARNYWRAGKDFYEKGDFASAVSNLKQVVKLSPKSTEGQNAYRLIANVKLLAGQASLTSRSEKAAGAKVQRDIQAQNVGLIARQDQLGSAGLEAERRGNVAEALAKYQAAEALTQDLLRQGADPREQAARMRQVRQGLARLQRRQEGKIAGLKKQLTERKAKGDLAGALELANQIRHERDTQFVRITDGPAANQPTSQPANGGAAVVLQQEQRELEKLTAQVAAQAGDRQTITTASSTRDLSRAPGSPSQLGAQLRDGLARAARPEEVGRVLREEADALRAKIAARDADIRDLTKLVRNTQGRAQPDLPAPPGDLPPAPGPGATREGLEKTVRVLREEIASRDEQIHDLTTKLRAIRKQPPAAVAALPDVAQPAKPADDFKAKVLAVNNDVASINAGTDAGVQAGTRLVLYRNGSFVARLRIAETDRKESVGIITGRKLDPVVGDWAAAVPSALLWGGTTGRYRTVSPEAEPGTSDLMRRYEKRLEVSKSAAFLDYDKAIARSKELLGRKEFDGAAEAARTARNGLEATKRLFTAKEYRRRLTMVEDQLGWIQKAKEENARLVVLRQRKQIEQAERQRTQREGQRKAARIEMLTEQARNLRKQKKYPEAIEVLTQIVELDPENEWATEWRQYLQGEARLRQARTKRQKEHRNVRTLHEPADKGMQDLREAEIPWWDIQRYPSDWREITALRQGQGAGAQSPQDRALQAKLFQQKISKLDFTDVELQDVISFLRDVTGLGIRVNWQALAAAGVDRATPVSVQLHDVSAADALRVVLDSTGATQGDLQYFLADGAITVTTRKDLSRHVSEKSYSVAGLIPRQAERRPSRRSRTAQPQAHGFFDSDRMEEDRPRTPDEQLAAVLRNALGSNLWRDAGGANELRIVNGRLALRADPLLRARAEALLVQLRQARSRPTRRAGRAPDDGGASRPAPRLRLIEKMRRARIPRLEFADIELKDVVAFLRDVTGLNIQVKWQALSVAGIDRTTAVTVDLTDVPVTKALDVILEDLSAAGGWLAYAVGDDLLVTISTAEDLSRITRSEIYDVRDITRGGADEDVADIITLLTETVDPTSWRRAGGEVGSVSALGGQLVVTNTPENHDRIRELLAMVRRGAAAARGEDVPRRPTALGQRIPKLDFTDIELKDVVSFLRDVTGLNIQVKWHALTVAGIDRTTAVSVRLRDVTVARALDGILADLGAKGTPLGYVMSDGVVTISTREDLSRKASVQVYDIRDMVTRIPNNFKGPRIELSQVASKPGSGGGGFFDDDGDASVDKQQAKVDETRSELTEDITRLIRETIDPTSWRAAGGETGSIRSLQGQLVVTATPQQQRQIASLLAALRRSRGPQVQRGERIAKQVARGQVDFGISRPHPATSQVPAVTTQRPVVSYEPSAEVKRFIGANYAWQAGRGHSGGHDKGEGEIDYERLARTLRFNLDQKVAVHSTNFALTRDVAESLGAEFTIGNNDVRFAVIDEGQFRTLQQIDRRNDPTSRVANPTDQETIVGTDALLSNHWTANVRFAGDRGNTLDIGDNPILLSHEKYVLLDNNGTLTAVRAGAMQHWREAAAAVQIAHVPEEIDVPRAGRVARFEKTLVKPTDDLTLRVEYVWEGD